LKVFSFDSFTYEVTDSEILFAILASVLAANRDTKLDFFLTTEEVVGTGHLLISSGPPSGHLSADMEMTQDLYQ